MVPSIGTEQVYKIIDVLHHYLDDHTTRIYVSRFVCYIIWLITVKVDASTYIGEKYVYVFANVMI